MHMSFFQRGRGKEEGDTLLRASYGYCLGPASSMNSEDPRGAHRSSFGAKGFLDRRLVWV